MWNILNKNRCETMADIFKDSIKFEKEWLDAIIKILSSDYKDSLEAGDLLCLSRGSLYYISWIEEKNKIETRKYNGKEERYYMEAMEWIGYLFQSWYEDFGITGKKLVNKLGEKDYYWLIDNWVILHTQDTKYVLEEMKKTRNLEF
ncbi:hypothetical protein [Clostridium taeniosporum]|uniref:Uncharacterized protein n=1 Tax=Clostridium taeniosporum TaxID=394958 RepID=A0A1D7XK78_9CLOT|nr:hypothetical protein [Clostridium taeniosporum]AOR23734.1 hypothetical protein BGI42_08310 [Clostridium taeniosporum]